jgi:hypothetical protein
LVSFREQTSSQLAAASHQSENNFAGVEQKLEKIKLDLSSAAIKNDESLVSANQRVEQLSGLLGNVTEFDHF